MTSNTGRNRRSKNVREWAVIASFVLTTFCNYSPFGAPSLRMVNAAPTFQVVMNTAISNKKVIHSSIAGDIPSVLSPVTITRSADLFNISSIEFVVNEYSTDGKTIKGTKTEKFHLSTKSFRKTGRRRSETLWHGSLLPAPIQAKSFRLVGGRRKKARTGSCMIYSSSGTILSAQFGTETATHELMYVNNKHIMRSTPWHAFPPDADHGAMELPPSGRYVNRGAPSSSFMGYVVDPNKRMDASEGWITEIGPAALQNRWPSVFATRAAVVVTTVDVLVVVTNRGMCEYYGIRNATCPVNATTIAPMQAKMREIEATTNAALRPISVRVRIVRIVFIAQNNTWDPIANAAGINSISTNSEVIALRDAVGADLVSVIGKNGGGFCGIGIMGGMRSVVAQGCLGQHSWSHEIGHSFGCDHNRESIANATHPYAYGWANGTSYRTLLSYNCKTKSCPRLPYYSSSTMLLPDGRALGNAANDNLRQINATAKIVAGWRAQKISYAPTRSPV